MYQQFTHDHMATKKTYTRKDERLEKLLRQEGIARWKKKPLLNCSTKCSTLGYAIQSTSTTSYMINDTRVHNKLLIRAYM